MQGRPGQGGADELQRQLQAKQMNEMRANLLYKSFHHRKKILYVVLSILLSAGLIIADLYDLIVLLSLHRADLTTHSAVESLTVSQVFYTV